MNNYPRFKFEGVGVQIVRYRGGSQRPRQRGIERTRSREQQRNTWISPPRKFHFYQKILEFGCIISFNNLLPPNFSLDWI